MQIQVKYCRLSFADIRKPYVPSDGSAPKYNATGICTDETRLVFTFEGKKYDIPHTDFNKVVVPMLFKEKGWDKVPKVLQNYSYARADESVGSRGPKISSKTEEYYDGYSEDTMFVAGSTKIERATNGIMVCRPASAEERKTLPPGVSSVVLPPESGKPVNGDVVTLLMGFYAYEYSGKKGHSASLDGVMYVRKGEHFGAAPAEPSAFDEEELEDELEDEEESAF